MRNDIAKTVVEQSKYEAIAEKEIEQSNHENEADTEVKIDIASPGEISSGKQFYKNSDISEINIKENTNVKAAEKEIEQFNHKNGADIKVKIDTTSPAEISSINTSNKFSEPTINTGKNVSKNFVKIGSFPPIIASR